MTELHTYVGFAVPTGFAVLVLWTIYSLVRNTSPGGAFWSLLGVLQAIVALQVVVGGILFLLGNRPASNGPVWLHYVYGGLFPAAVLIVAHRFAKRFEDLSWLVFGVASFIAFGLTLRALQTGLGID